MPYTITEDYRYMVRGHAQARGSRWVEPPLGATLRVHLTEDGVLLYQCPGCDVLHGIPVTTHPRDPRVTPWGWNGNIVRPTLTPSVLSHGSVDVRRCHHFVRDGWLEFLGDCDHGLRLKRVEMPAVDF